MSPIPPIPIEVLSDAGHVASRAATLLATAVSTRAAECGQCVLAVSGGHTPWRTFELLAHANVPWPKLHVIQVDERIAPAGDPDRNWTHLTQSLLTRAPIPPEHAHAIPVEDDVPERAAARYQTQLEKLSGTPPRIDIVQLGLGDDGHTASLVPGDPVLESRKVVAVSEPYRGHRRITLTLATLNHAGWILWIVTGEEKAEALGKLMKGDRSIPASRIRRERVLVLADLTAAQGIEDAPR